MAADAVPQRQATLCEHRTAKSACDLCRVARRDNSARYIEYKARIAAGTVQRRQKAPEFVRVPCCLDEHYWICAGTNSKVIKQEEVKL